MEEKFDELINIFGKNKKSLVYLIVIYVIVMVGVITFIWWPKQKDYATYTPINITTKKTEMAQNYINIVRNLFASNNTSEIRSLISSEYISYTGKKVEDIIYELEALGFFSNNIEVRGMNIYEDGDIYVYSTTVYSGNNNKVVNLIEKAPYDYEIVFDDFYSYDEVQKTTASKNIEFTINSIYKNLKYIELDMSIENLKDTDVQFNFSNDTSLQAVLENGTKYSLANLVSTDEYTNVLPNMTINKKFVFEVPAQLQEGIEYIVFNGVKLEFSSSNIRIDI